jgi:hypothetical protein
MLSFSSKSLKKRRRIITSGVVSPDYNEVKNENDTEAENQVRCEVISNENTARNRYYGFSLLMRDRSDNRA